jgi:LmbE family N-acetylglucosaminyl deacetylase
MNSSIVDILPADEDWSRALVVVAHPDDMEFGGSAGAVARWVKQGKEVAYVLITSGEAGIDAVEPERARGIRENEQLRSCAVVGVTDVVFLGMPDGVLTYDIPLRQAIARQIRRFRPDVVVTLNFREGWGDAELNHPDHVVTGRALLDAVRDAANRWVFREQLDDEGLAPWRGVRQAWVAGSPAAGHAVDITETFDVAVEALRVHRVYNVGLRWPGFEAHGWLDTINSAVGRRLGVPYAVAFEVLDVHL